MTFTSWLQRHYVLSSFAFGLAAAVLVVWWHFDTDFEQARARVKQGSLLIETRCGSIEYQEAGTGVPLLAVHGMGGGYDRGLALGAPLAKQGVRVIAMSRFGYLRTPMPIDASPEAQAEAYMCLLDALGIKQAAVMGYSAGAPSALQLAIRHPDRVSALVLLVPIAYSPSTKGYARSPVPQSVETTILADFLLWSGLHLARDQVIKFALATPAELVATASATERARVDAMLDDMLPVLDRAAGSRNDGAIAENLSPLPLGSVRAPTLTISTRDDGYGTYASAQYTASQIAGAKFVGFETGGHTWIGHDDQVMTEIFKLLKSGHEGEKP